VELSLASVVLLIFAIVALIAGISSLLLFIKIIINRKQPSMYTTFFLNQKESASVSKLYFYASIPFLLSAITMMIFIYYLNMASINPQYENLAAMNFVVSFGFRIAALLIFAAISIIMYIRITKLIKKYIRV